MNELGEMGVGFDRPGRGEAKPIWDTIRRRKGRFMHERTQSEPSLRHRKGSKRRDTYTTGIAPYNAPGCAVDPVYNTRAGRAAPISESGQAVAARRDTPKRHGASRPTIRSIAPYKKPCPRRTSRAD